MQNGNMWLNILTRLEEASLPHYKNNHRLEMWSSEVTFSLTALGLTSVCSPPETSLKREKEEASFVISCSDGRPEGGFVGGVFCEEGGSGWGPSEWGGAEADVFHQTEAGRTNKGISEVNINHCGGGDFWRLMEARAPLINGTWINLYILYAIKPKISYK